MKRIFIGAMLFSSPGCWSQHHNPLSQVDIHAAPEVQAQVIEATKRFGERNGFKVSASNNLPREGRQVIQVLLTRSDGVLISTSNFMHEQTLETFFSAEKEGADWRTAKEKWLTEMRVVVGRQGNVVDVILERAPKGNQE